MIDHLPPPQPVDAVIFDFHSTLFDSLDPFRWIDGARSRIGHGEATEFGPAGDDVRRRGLAEHLHDIWAHAATFDPSSERDLDQDRHREVFLQAVSLCPGGVAAEFAEALYAVMTDQWIAFDDTVPVLRGLRSLGIRTAVLSNIGVDIRPRLNTTGVSDLVDDVVMSYEVGLVKPDPRIFALSLHRLGVPADRALMVGDSWQADAGGAVLGLRTLVLPRTTGSVHGLASVLHLVGHHRSGESAPPSD